MTEFVTHDMCKKHTYMQMTRKYTKDIYTHAKDTDTYAQTYAKEEGVRDT